MLLAQRPSFLTTLQDMPACVRLIAEFLQLGHDDPTLQAIALEQADINHMRQFPEKYDEVGLF